MIAFLSNLQLMPSSASQSCLCQLPHARNNVLSGTTVPAHVYAQMDDQVASHGSSEHVN